MIIVIITNNIYYSIDILLLRLLSSTKYHDGIAFRNHTMYLTLINKHVSVKHLHRQLYKYIN